MPLTATEFWSLLGRTGLIGVEQMGACQQKARAEIGAAILGDESKAAAAIAKWLVAQKRITVYQARLLLAGHSQSFHYGPFCILARGDQHFATGLFRAQFQEPAVPAEPSATGTSAKPPVRRPSVVAIDFVPAPSLAAVRASVDQHRQVRHPHLSQIYGVSTIDDQSFCVGEWPLGRNLADMIAKQPRWTLSQAVQAVFQLAGAVQALHHHDLPHGDIRAESIWCSEKGNLLLLLRRPALAANTIGWSGDDPDGTHVARSDYAAPELFVPNRSIDCRTDCYAIGCLFYRLLTGALPFSGGDWTSKAHRHATEPIRPLSEFGQFPAQLEELVRYLMAKNSDIRIADGGQLQQRLLVLYPQLSQLPVAMAPPSRSIEQYFSTVPTAGQPARQEPPYHNAGQDPLHPVVVAVDSVVDRHRRPRRRWPLLVGAAILAAAGTAALMLASNKTADKSKIASPTASVTANTPESDNKKSSPAGDENNAHDPVDRQTTTDDGEMLWSSPTAGPPGSLDSLPPGGLIYVLMRPAELLATEEGARVWRALGPAMSAFESRFQSATGYRFAEIESLQIGTYPGPQDNMAVLMAVGLAADAKDTFKTQSASETEYLGTLYRNSSGGAEQGGGWYVTAPTDEAPRSFWVGAEAPLREAIARRTEPTVHSREVAQMVAASDPTRHFNMIFSPRYFQVSVTDRFPPGGAAFVSSLDNVWRETRMGLISVHVDSPHQFFGEFRGLPSNDLSGRRLADAVRQHVDQVPNVAERYLSSLDSVDRYWRRLALRYQAMLRLLRQETRIGIEDRQVFANFSLPVPAGHNLILATELALASFGETSGPRTEVPKKTVATMTDVLASRLSISIPQQSLEFCVRDLALILQEQTLGVPPGFEIKILGADLQKEGITRNQQISNFEKKDVTVSQILTDLVLAANPDRTVTGPSDPAQKLVWVVEGGGDPAHRILFTTRAAAAASGYSLPPIFRSK